MSSAEGFIQHLERYVLYWEQCLLSTQRGAFLALPFSLVD